MAEPRSFYDKTRECMPEGMHELKLNALAVAILKHDQKPQGPKSEGDYLWIKCGRKTTAPKLLQQCKLRLDSLQEEEIVLKHGPRILDANTPMSEIGDPQDRLVVLEVFGKSEMSSRLLADRQPLEPTHQHQVNQNAKAESVFNANKLKPQPFRPPKPEPQDENQMPSSGDCPMSPHPSGHESAPQAPTLRWQRYNVPTLSRSSGPLAYNNPCPTSASLPANYIPPSQTSQNFTGRGSNPLSPPTYNVHGPLSSSDAALSSYMTQDLANAHSRDPEKSEGEVVNVLHAQWSDGGPICRAYPASHAGREPNHMDVDSPAFSREQFPRHTDGCDKSLPRLSAQGEEQQSFQLHDLLKDAEPEVLEISVKQGLKLLEKLKKPLTSKASQDSDAPQWIQQINNLCKQAVPTKTIIGVVGNTGAGKSSVINAMLDEERLVPTNCMRACTAVVTELSYNYEQQPYRAEIDFVSLEDWRKELEILFHDLLDLNGAVSRECSNEDSDAGIAYAKIKAVYPRKTKEDIANSSIDSMLREVSQLLGGNEKITETDSSRFYNRLQRYVDISMSDHPLYLQAVIVDLSGVHDSNAARAAVAEGYIKQCTGLWIVSPIQRSIDEKSAKVLLSESFKRQLKMDGGFNAVTFICSKTDDISLTEAQDSLDLGDELGALWAEIEDLSTSLKGLKEKRQDIEKSKAVHMELMDDADEQLEVWEGLNEELDDGKTVFASKANSAGIKRKASGSQKPRKKLRADSNRDDNDHSADQDIDDQGASDESNSSDEHVELLTQGAISQKLAEIRANKKKARQEKARLESKIKDLNSEMTTLESKAKTIEADISAKCIAGRNEYSKGAIRQDFASGIKELDQDIAAEQDEENFDPDHEIRDYDQVAQNLKCFCVSARAYQKLSALWASSDGTGEKLNTEQREREAQLLSQNLRTLENSLDAAVTTTCKNLGEEFGDGIFDRYESAVGNAVKEASNTATMWGAPVNRDSRAAGGLFWATYRAIVRREGVYTNAQGPHEWNAQLAEPMMKILAAGWEKTFSRRTPSILAGFVRDATESLKHFHHNIDQRARKIGLGIAGLHALKQQLSVYDNILKDIAKEATETVSRSKKDINREFIPVIQQEMGGAYQRCLEQHGPGSYARMKSAMLEHVDHRRHTMFQQSVDEVRKQLKKLLQDLGARMNDKTDDIFSSIQRDYRSVLVGGGSPGELLPKSERLSRAKVLRLIDSVETIFRKIAVGEPVEDNDDGEPLAGETDYQVTKKEGQPFESNVSAEPKPHKDHSPSKENDCTAVHAKPSLTIKLESLRDRPIKDVLSTRGDTPIKASLPSIEPDNKPNIFEAGSEGSNEDSLLGQNEVVRLEVRMETPDALDAQLLRGAQVGGAESESGYGGEGSD